MAFSKEDFLIRFASLALLTALALAAQPRVDNVLVRMVPSGATALAGAEIQALLASPLYRRLVEVQAAPMFDRFAAETGFDPRRDVRELLFATLPQGGVLLARGKFNLGQKPFPQAILLRYGAYNIWTANGNGLCLLDGTLAAAGKIAAVQAALDEWDQKGIHAGAQPLLARLRLSDPAAQLWAVAGDISSLLPSGLLAGAGSGLDFSALFRGLTDTWLQASVASGVKFEAHSTAATVKDAIALRDTFKGAIGFGRLSVPEDQPELLPVFDGIAVEQQDRSIAIRIDLPQNRIDPLAALLTSRTRR